MEPTLKTWPVQDAKARFSELLDTCIAESPQRVTRHGTETAVLLPMHGWQRLQRAAPVSIKQWLLSDEARVDLDLPPRGTAQRRTPVALR